MQLTSTFLHGMEARGRASRSRVHHASQAQWPSASQLWDVVMLRLASWQDR